MTHTLNLVFLGYLGLGGGELAILFIPLLLFIIPMIFYLLTLQSTLQEISPENRKMEPGQVWLVFVPFFGIVWQFIIINRLADSLKLEFSKRNIPVIEDRPGYSLGLTYCILSCCGIIPILGILASLGALVCWIIYWVKINGFKTQLTFNR